MSGFTGGNSGAYVREGHGKKQFSKAAKKVEQHQLKEAEKQLPTLIFEDDFDTDSASLKGKSPKSHSKSKSPPPRPDHHQDCLVDKAKDLLVQDKRERTQLVQDILGVTAFSSKTELTIVEEDAEWEHGVFAWKVESKLAEKEMKRDVRDKRANKANKAGSKVKDRRGGSEMSFFAGGEE